MSELLDRLAEGEILIGDGATGTYLQGRGLEVGEAPESWTLSHPETVREMAADYFSAGSDIVETNTFGGNRLRLEKAGLADRVAEINRTAAELALSASHEGGFVAGSVGPTGEFLEPLGNLTAEVLAEVSSEQIRVLADAGVDAICVETMTDLSEAEAIVRVAREITDLPVMATMTFDEGPRGFATSMGVSVSQAVTGLTEAGAHIVGTNCGNGMDKMVAIVKEMGVLTDLPILVQANAGLPVMDGDRVLYPETPGEMAARCEELVASGARIVGGCCGTGPAHITAFAETIRQISQGGESGG